jgi:hypothetical protein
MLFADLFSNPTESLGMFGLGCGLIFMWMLKGLGGGQAVARRGCVSWINRLIK